MKVVGLEIYGPIQDGVLSDEVFATGWTPNEAEPPCCVGYAND